MVVGRRYAHALHVIQCNRRVDGKVQQADLDAAKLQERIESNRALRTHNLPGHAMRLTSYTDYSLRTLMYLAKNREHLITIQDIADTQGIAKNHLTKVVHQLGLLGLIETTRGRHGGLRLKREPGTIRIGEVVRQTEPDFQIAECFNPETQGCIYFSSCVLKGVLARAAQAFLAELDSVTLENLLQQEEGNAPVLGQAMPITFMDRF